MRRSKYIDKAHFLVFSNEVDPFSRNAEDYCEAALRAGFDSATHYTQRMLRETPFWDENKDILEQKRGAGYWLWKPYIILEKLRSVGPNDVVVYNDAGRYEPGRFNQFPQFPNAAVELCALTPKRFIHGFVTNWLVQGNYTKRDCLILMGADTEEMRLASQVNACPLIFMPSQESLDFLESWLEYARDPRNLTDDADTLGPSHREFEEHRHDQAIASVLLHQKRGHCFDMSANGGEEPAELLRQRYPDVPRLTTHIGYLSQVVEYHLPKDFWLLDNFDISSAGRILRNLTPDESIFQHTLSIPSLVLQREYDHKVRHLQPTMSREEILAELANNRGLTGRLHVLKKMPESYEQFWQIAIAIANARLAELAASGASGGDLDKRRFGVEAIHAAEAQLPDIRQQILAAYIWSVLDKTARDAFKAVHKNFRNSKGRAAMERFARSLIARNLVDYEVELLGNGSIIPNSVSRLMMDWLIGKA